MTVAILNAMKGRHILLGQKNFTLGPVKEIFERWCESNGYKERETFFAAFIAFQAMSHETRKEWFILVERWAQDEFKHDGEWSAAVLKTAGSESRPGEKEPSRGSRRAAS